MHAPQKTFSTIDLTCENQMVKAEFFRAFEEIYDKNQLQAGPSLEQFRNSLSTYVGTKFAGLTGGGTMSLHVAAKALGLKEGDEVICPANTFFATATGIAHAGPKIVLADVDADSHFLTPETVQAVVTPKTKALALVHLYGGIIDPEPFRQFGVPLIEDASHAFGGDFRGKRVGNLMDIGVFSAGFIKGFGALGHSGFITYNQEKFDKYIQAFVSNGQLERHIASVFGHNFMMDCLNALFLDLKLKHWPEITKRRRAAQKSYDETFAGTEIKPQKQTPGANPALWVYVVRVDSKIRDQVLADLKEAKIQALVQYTVTVNQMPAWKEIAAREAKVPVSEKLIKEIISLPVHAGIEPADAKHIAETTIEIVGRRMKAL